MNPGREEERQRLHVARVALRTGERAAFLRRECAHDGSLREEVEGLLAMADEVESAFDETTPPDADPLTGRKPDDFEILEWIARGGSDAVYLARQLSTDRLVARKVLQSLFRDSRVAAAVREGSG